MSVKHDLDGEFDPRKANPFYIPEITDHMLQFLNLSDIKNCRAVCRQWNELAEKFQSKLSVVNILKPERVEEFNQEFPDVQQCQIFTCFKFDGFKWPLYKFISFCENWYQNLSEVTIIGADFGMEKENQTYDLSALLPSTLIKLKVGKSHPQMILAADKMSNIRILELEGCILNIVPNIVLNPVEIVLENVTFREGNEKMEEFLINPLLNFDVLKKASFSGKNIMLDLRGSHSLNMLSLQEGVAVLNWETSNWKLKKLFLRVYPCKELRELSKSPIKYEELNIALTHLNVSLLPEGIRKLLLTLHYDQEVPPRISGEHNFPDLKCLYITFRKGNDFAPFVESFKHCPRLSHLLVSCSPGNGEIILKTSSVPPAVKILIVAFSVRVIVDQSLQLLSVVYCDTHLCGPNNNIVDIAKELHVKSLIWVGYDAETALVRYRNIFDNEEGNLVKSLIHLNMDTFLVGEFSQVNNSEFEKSYLFPLVDTQGKYYLFQRGQKGKAIDGSYLVSDLKIT